MRLDETLTHSDAGFSAKAVNGDADLEDESCLVRCIMKCLGNGASSELDFFFLFLFHCCDYNYTFFCSLKEYNTLLFM